MKPSEETDGGPSSRTMCLFTLQVTDEARSQAVLRTRALANGGGIHEGFLSFDVRPPDIRRSPNDTTASALIHSLKTGFILTCSTHLASPLSPTDQD